MSSRAATLVTGIVRRFGFELVRRPTGASLETAPPALRGNPLEALVATRTGEQSAFLCPVHSIVMLNGFGFGERGWHPFAATLQEHRHNPDITYPESLLYRFYSIWQPRRASDAIVGFTRTPEELQRAPSYGYHFSPWCTGTLSDQLEMIRKFCAADYEEHGPTDLKLDVDGFKYHGPVSARLGEVEYQRLLRVYGSLSSQSYDRRHGDVNVYVLRRGQETRYVCRGGVHRVAALCALGEASIPARLCAPYLVDLAESSGWPQVVRGVWDLGAAEQYFNHLFDFGALDWAAAAGLAPSIPVLAGAKSAH